MKNLFKIAAMSFLLALGACSEGTDESGTTGDDNNDNNNSGDVVATETSLTVSLSAMSRAGFVESGDKIEITWSSGDKISLYDNSGSFVEEVTLSSTYGSASGTFKCSDILEDDTYTVVYPSLGSSYSTLSSYQSAMADLLVAQTQLGALISHLNTACSMEGEVTITDGADADVTLAHNTALLTISFDVSDVPTQVVVDETYAITLESAIPVNDSYTANILIDPSTIAVGDFDITIYYGESDSVTGTESISAAYAAGSRYDIDLGYVGYTMITSEADLLAFATAAAGDSSEMKYALAKDITLTSEWTPIAEFNGVLDGKDCYINGLEINQPTTAGVAFILTLGGTVKNLAFYEPSVTGQRTTAVLASTATADAYITNCHIDGGSVTSVGGSADSTDGDETGGLVALNYCDISWCSNSASVTGANDYIGGVVARCMDALTISYCYNTGTIEGGTNDSQGNSTGGVVGILISGKDITVTNCFNTGNVTGDMTVGGVVARNDGSTKVYNCYNTGHIKANHSYVGGVTGYTKGTLMYCYSVGSVENEANTKMGGILGAPSGTPVYEYLYYISDSAIGSYGTCLADLDALNAAFEEISSDDFTINSGNILPSVLGESIEYVK